MREAGKCGALASGRVAFDDEVAVQEADRRKSEFLATLGHELRNPLAAIRSALSIIKVAPGNGQALQQAREVMERQVIQIARLIDDLLDATRLTYGKLECVSRASSSRGCGRISLSGTAAASRRFPKGQAGQRVSRPPAPRREGAARS
jgi:signal transduction histidine kinase